MKRVAALTTLLGMITIWTSAWAEPATPRPMSTPAALAESAVGASLRPVARRLSVPEARWDGAPGRKAWTLAVLDALNSHASELPELVPHDIGNYCPAYPTADRAQREAFWVGMISSLAWHESTHRPTAVGGGGLWYGLTQILPATARGYECKARTGEALKDPEANLSCALRIMAVTVPRDMVISYGMKGVAADWGPFHQRRKRHDIMNWTRSQEYCVGLSRSLRPVVRPDDKVRMWRQAQVMAELESIKHVRPTERPLEIEIAQKERLDDARPERDGTEPLMSTQSEG